MAVRKQCKGKGCSTSPRCHHPWWFDVMHKGGFDIVCPSISSPWREARTVR